jgi:hypothetical protein
MSSRLCGTEEQGTAGAEGKDLAGVARTQQHPLRALPCGGSAGALDTHLLVTRIVRPR